MLLFRLALVLAAVTALGLSLLVWLALCRHRHLVSLLHGAASWVDLANLTSCSFLAL